MSEIAKEYKVNEQARTVEQFEQLVMPILDLGKYTTAEQTKKVIEEYLEWENEYEGTKQDLEESIDVIQAMWGYINNTFNKQEIEEGFARHYEKLSSREDTNRGHRIIGYMTLNFKRKSD